MLQNQLQDVVGKVAELLAHMILCAYKIKGRPKDPKKSKKIRVSFLGGKSVFRNCDLQRVIKDKFVKIHRCGAERGK